MKRGAGSEIVVQAFRPGQAEPSKGPLLGERNSVAVSVDTLLAEALARGAQLALAVLAVSDGGYTTHLSFADVTRGKAWVTVSYDGAPLAPGHGGPVRLLVPHHCLGKSAKSVRQLRLMDRDEAGFWESLGYHNCGDPWCEQRYGGDP
jgi:DMSO/TMAO reductase YedYZ molybdopterin-dependent catalytic subunit